MFTIIDTEIEKINDVIDQIHDLRNYGILYGMSDSYASCLNAMANKLNGAVNSILDKIDSDQD